MTQFRKLLITAYLLFLIGGGVVSQNSAQPDSILMGNYWKQQGLQEIIPYWSQHAIDSQHGGFYTYLKRDWQQYNGTNKYPGMQARHLYSYSVAYLLSGERKYLGRAESTFQFLAQQGWDERHHSWFDAIDTAGEPVKTTKDLFMQTYAITGHALYYITTLDSQVYPYLQKGLITLEQNALDNEYEGYFRTLHRNLSVKDSSKEFTPNIAPVSGYLAYMYSAFRESPPLQQWVRQGSVAINNLQHPEKEWIRESFTHDWEPHSGENQKANIGHNIEVVWILLRLYMLTDIESYKQKALALNQRLMEYAFDADKGVWYNWVKIDDPTQHAQQSSWWVQAYGNMTCLYLYRVTGKQKYLDYFQKGARFWNRYFVDDQYGATVLKVNLEGEVTKGAKAVRSKTSYHAMEHSLLNYLYLRLWVEEKPVTLYYHIAPNHQRENFYPLPIEAPRVSIDSVKLNGEFLEQSYPQHEYLTIPAHRSGRLKVVLRPE